MKYEIFYLVGTSRESDLETIKSSVKKMIIEEGGIFEEKETQEKRKMSYEIKKERFGFYMAQRFELGDPEKISLLNSKLNLFGDVSRFIISRADDLPALKSKEEKIAAATKRSHAQSSAANAEKVRSAPDMKAEEVKKMAETEKDKQASQEDIDKKLEEILNI